MSITFDKSIENKVIEMLDRGPIDLIISRILEVWNPFDILMSKNLEEVKIDVLHYIKNKDFQRKYLENIFGLNENYIRDLNYDIRRIAWFVYNGWEDAVDIDVGINGFDTRFICHDGNHRLCAAIIKGDKTIKAKVSGGCDIISYYCGLVD
ncbi:MAG: hypothetical protein AABY32_01525 [Nanoarchaeota archaeon]